MINTHSFSYNLKSNLNSWINKNRMSITTLILLIGLIAFEMFNYSTTDYALKDLLGDLSFLGIYWATILAIAFCLIDFAGISKLFNPGNTVTGLKEDWFLFGAWFLAATMNAILTWWGVSMSIVNHSIISATIIDSETIHLVVPLFVAIMVWITRILLIGSLTLSGQNSTPRSRPSVNTKKSSSLGNFSSPVTRYGSAISASRSSKRPSSPISRMYNNDKPNTRPEPEYISDPSNSVHQPAFMGKSQSNTSSRRF